MPLTSVQIAQLEQAQLPQPLKTAIMISMFSGVIGRSLLTLQRENFKRDGNILVIKKDHYRTFIIDPGSTRDIAVYINSIGRSDLFLFSNGYYKKMLWRTGKTLGFPVTQRELRQTFVQLWIAAGGDHDTLKGMIGDEVQ